MQGVQIVQVIWFFRRDVKAVQIVGTTNASNVDQFEITKRFLKYVTYMNLNKKPYLGITMGDPSGIGAEVIAKSLLNDSIFDKCIPVIFGNSNLMLNNRRI